MRIAARISDFICWVQESSFQEGRLCRASSADPTDYMQSGGIPAFNVSRGIPSKTVSFGYTGNSGSHRREFRCLTTGATDNHMYERAETYGLVAFSMVMVLFGILPVTPIETVTVAMRPAIGLQNEA
jgi:hypothetical protein